MPQLEVVGGAIEYVVINGRNDRAPLVFLHHGLGSIAGWFRIYAPIAAATDRKALIYSRHGYGHSAPATIPRLVSYLDHESTVVLPEVLKRMGFEEPVLVGHGDGAAIALLYAARSPKKLPGLALMAPLVSVEEHTLKGIRAAEAEFINGDLRAKLALIHDNPNAAFYGWHDVWLSHEFRNWDIAHQFDPVTSPTLVISGCRDEFASSFQADALVPLSGSLTSRVEIAEAPHEIHLTHPEVVTRTIIEFLAATSPEGPNVPAVQTLAQRGTS
ncbi:alpha/beta fold hydrolase [Streptomyces sp. NBC_01092]|uniref:alpha/beta fold hydrolase n=1 Tax=Streptomyces sp. NBC_01092 TaxID=2903748 RepID=UPI00386C8A18|nr:alpha/beta hydrolase [Streptomyces sp. NBC_01092]